MPPGDGGFFICKNMAKKYTDLMIDFETLGTSVDSAIISMGAVRFNLDSNEIDDSAFYASISVDSNLEAGRTISESTLIWWMGQSKEAQKVFTEPKMTLEIALGEFFEWFGEADDNIRVWSNGADFDIPMMAHAMKHFGWELPWKFWNHKCFRTFKGLPCAKLAKKPDNALAHNALNDAIAQAKYAQAIQAVLKGLK